MLSTGNPAFYGASANASTCGAIRSDLHIQMLPPQPALALPILPDPDFLERPDIAAWIRNNCAEANSRVALVGPGGIGKTQLALQYAYEIRQRHEEIPIFWVPASTSSRFEAAYRDIAAKLQLPQHADPNADTLGLVCDWLCDEENGRWMMVLDNVDDVQIFHSRHPHGSATEPPAEIFLPKSRHGSILITSRSVEIARRLTSSMDSVYEVPALDEDQASRLAANKLGESYDEVDATDLARALEHIPLAIKHAVAFMSRQTPRMSVSRYVHEFREANRTSGPIRSDAGNGQPNEDALNTIEATWQVTFGQVQRERPSAADLLSLMSFFLPDSVPESVLRSHQREAKGHDFDEDLEILRGYSLVESAAESGVLAMQPLVQDCIQNWLRRSGAIRIWELEFLRTMSAQYPTAECEDWSMYRKFDAHIESIIGTIPRDSADAMRWAVLLTNAGWYRGMSGRYIEAEAMLRAVVDAREQVLGAGHPDTLTGVHNLAQVLSDQGKLSEAEQMHRRVLDEREKTLGLEHPQTLMSASNLASVLWNRGMCRTAAQMQRQALYTREKVLGKEHPHTLASANNLASMLLLQGKYDEAEQLLRRAILGLEKVLGPEHRYTLTSISNLAFLLRDGKRTAEAAELYERAYSSHRKVLGPAHPRTVSCRNHARSTREEMASLDNNQLG